MSPPPACQYTEGVPRATERGEKCDCLRRLSGRCPLRGSVAEPEPEPEPPEPYHLIHLAKIELPNAELPNAELLNVESY
jgi:hypothetical protein